MEHPKSYLTLLFCTQIFRKVSQLGKLSRIFCSLPQESEDTVSNRINEQM